MKRTALNSEHVVLLATRSLSLSFTLLLSCSLLEGKECSRCLATYYCKTSDSCEIYCRNLRYVLLFMHAQYCPSMERFFSSHCTAIMCPMPSTPRNGRVAMTNENFYTSIATYSCDFGFRMLGTSTRQCQPTGIWTETPPGCYGEAEGNFVWCCGCVRQNLCGSV